MIAAAGILFVTPDRRALLLKRSADADHPAEWCTPGGMARSGEKPYDTALRESREELGDTFEDGDARDLGLTSIDGVDYTTFLMPVRAPFTPTLNGEHTAFEWRPLDNLPGKTHPGVRKLLPRLHDFADAIAQDRMAMDRAQRDGLALDRGTVRRIDPDGRLHVELTNISKANVCPYYGSEIPDSEQLGLEPDRTYQLLRDPDELRKAAATFNNIPLMSEHIPVSAAEPQKELIVGSTGTDAVFDAPYLRNSLVVWDSAFIERIDSNKQKELSCGYRYRADMSPGIFEGTPYDGVMRDIVGNHVALVEQGRAGSDVVVGDSILEIPMSKKVVLSRTAALAQGALAVFLLPLMAADAKPINLQAIVKDVTAKNWTASKSKIVAAITKATEGKLAADAKLDNMPGMLDQLDKQASPEEMPDDNLQNDNGGGAGGPDDEFGANAGSITIDDDPMEQMRAFLTSKGMSPEDVEQACAMMGTTDELPEPKVPAEGGPPTMGAAALPARPATSNNGNPRKGPPAMDRKAMDAAISTQVALATKQAQDTARQTARDIAEAERMVRPYIGEVIAMDSAAAVYKAALEHYGVDLKGVHESAFKSMASTLLPKMAASSIAQPQVIAGDAASDAAFTETFPTARAVRQL